MISRERQIIDQIPHLRRYARALVRDSEVADDLVQECLARAMGRLHAWQPTGTMRSWLFTILHNLHVNELRRDGRAPEIHSDSDGVDRESASGDPGAGLAVRDITAALAALPEEQRSVILLVGLEGLTYAEAASVADVPVGTVMSRLARGRERLREIMEFDSVTPLRRAK
ncbi:MAG: sigma-70 family RNA polymerase sigma factor [Alphaproteobacteria bacterium]